MTDFVPDHNVPVAVERAASPTVSETVEQHVRQFFADRQIDVLTWPHGPLKEINPGFHVLRVTPAAPGKPWTYVSVGAWAATAPSDTGLEFVISTESPTDRAVELLTMVTYFHHDTTLDLGHTCFIGEPWLPKSKCDHLLVSLPYPYGPDLEVCHAGARHVSVLWLLPITKAERDFKAEHGLEALEQRFDEAAIDYVDVDRDSVC